MDPPAPRPPYTLAEAAYLLAQLADLLAGGHTPGQLAEVLSAENCRRAADGVLAAAKELEHLRKLARSWGLLPPPSVGDGKPATG